MSKLGHWDAVLSDTGVPIPATITVYNAGTSNLSSIWSDAAGTIVKDNPFQTDALGRFQFFATSGKYDIEVLGTGITTYKIENVNISDVTKSTELTDMPGTLGVPNAGKVPAVKEDGLSYELVTPETAAHAINGAKHTATGLTAGQFMRASAPTAFGFAAIQDGDLPATRTLAAPVADHSGAGILISLTAHEAQAIGDLCYIASDGKAKLAKADAIANANSLVMVSQASIGSGAAGNYMLYGLVRDDSWSWTVGGKIYLSTTGTTGNTLTQTAPSGANNVVQIVGVALSAHIIIFRANLVQVEHV